MSEWNEGTGTGPEILKNGKRMTATEIFNGLMENEQLEARCAEQQGIIERLRETITIRGQRLAVLSGENIRLESEKAQQQWRIAELAKSWLAESAYELTMRANSRHHDPRYDTYSAGFRAALDKCAGEIEQPTPHPAESEDQNRREINEAGLILDNLAFEHPAESEGK